jgi:hypothetical protein
MVAHNQNQLNSVGTDTRHFLRPHVHANFDFAGVRSLDTSLHARIPTPFRYTGRDVLYRSRRFELWSPNSTKTPIYPGMKPIGLSLTPPLIHRRTDGSGGRFDWTLIPQYLDRSVLHHPFILDPERADGSSAEFIYLTTVWQSLPNSSHGRLNRSFYTSLLDRAAELEKKRQDMLKILPPDWLELATLVSDAPTSSHIRRYEGDIDWDTCVEQLTYIQRVLREKDGWIRMTIALSCGRWRMGDTMILQAGPVIAANDNMLGAWVNGADERIVQWFLHIGVPCFIIHEYREGVDFGHGIRERRNRHCTDSFSLPTVWHLRHDINAYEVVAMRNNTFWSTDPAPPPPPHSLSITSSLKALECSSSHFHGYSRSALEIYQQPEPKDGDIIWPSTICFPDHIPWIRPPPIIAAEKPGPWSRFSVVSLDLDNGNPFSGRDVMQQRSAKFTGDGNLLGPYYDRQNKRQLYFDCLPPVPGLVSDTVFGCPVPFYHFVGPNSLPLNIHHSEWMYYSKEPLRSDIGKEPPQPTAADLTAFGSTAVARNPYEEGYEDDVGFPRRLSYLAPPLVAISSSAPAENMGQLAAHQPLPLPPLDVFTPAHSSELFNMLNGLLMLTRKT